MRSPWLIPAFPMMVVASAAYWLVASMIIERRLGLLRAVKVRVER